jgi:hypothetical protein
MADFTNPLTQAPITNKTLPVINYDMGALITGTEQGAGTQGSGDLRNPIGRGIRVVLDITAKSGTIDVVVNIYAKDNASGKYILLLASASKTATGTTELLIHPDLTAAANTIAKSLLGDVFKIEVVNGAGSTPSATYTVGATLLA